MIYTQTHTHTQHLPAQHTRTTHTRARAHTHKYRPLTHTHTHTHTHHRRMVLTASFRTITASQIKTPFESLTGNPPQNLKLSHASPYDRALEL